MRIDLNVPYTDRDAAKILNARWDAARKTWYVSDPEDLTQFVQWIDADYLRPHKYTEYEREFIKRGNHEPH